MEFFISAGLSSTQKTAKHITRVSCLQEKFMEMQNRIDKGKNTTAENITPVPGTAYAPGSPIWGSDTNGTSLRVGPFATVRDLLKF